MKRRKYKSGKQIVVEIYDLLDLLVNDLKAELKKEIDAKPDLKIKDYVSVFLKFVMEHDSLAFFGEKMVMKDEASFGIELFRNLKVNECCLELRRNLIFNDSFSNVYFGADNHIIILQLNFEYYGELEEEKWKFEDLGEIIKVDKWWGIEKGVNEQLETVQQKMESSSIYNNVCLLEPRSINLWVNFDV